MCTDKTCVLDKTKEDDHCSPLEIIQLQRHSAERGREENEKAIISVPLEISLGKTFYPFRQNIQIPLRDTSNIAHMIR